MRRLTPYLLVTVLVIGSGLGIGLGLSEAPATSSATHQPSGCSLIKTFDRDGLRFHYPSCWTSAYYEEFAAFFSPIVDLSDQAMHKPCHQVPSDQPGTSVVCGEPVNQLQPGHVLVVWLDVGQPGLNLSKVPGRPLSIGGRPGRETVSRVQSNRAPSIGAD